MNFCNPETGKAKNTFLLFMHLKKVESGETFELKVTIGDAVGHPNTLEHHIKWFKVFFHGEGDKFPVELANFTFDGSW